MHLREGEEKVSPEDWRDKTNTVEVMKYSNKKSGIEPLFL
jgi:hypothetical protein